jgi:hypothetical protein
MPDSQPSDLIDPGVVRIRNQRYQPWPEIVLGMFVAVCVAAMFGLFVIKRLAPVDCVIVGATIAGLANFIFRCLLPRLGSIRQIKLGYCVETAPLVWRYPARSVKRIAFAPDPAEDYVERDKPTRLYEATIELESEKPFRMIVDETDAGRLRAWAVAREIAVCDHGQEHSQMAEPASEV